jgi:membrane-associated protease RseP (regulator of RpoE activity)
MKPWLILILLSPIAYILVQRSLKNITTTPVWLCWLVMMLPAFIWTTWVYVFGEEPIPLPVFLFPLIICPILYGWLVQRGKLQTETTPTQTDKQENMATPKPAPESSPLRPIDIQEEKILRNCFPWDVYYLQNIDYRPQAIFCRGKLKTIPDKAYEKIKHNIEAAFGDRFFLIFQESLRGKPFFALVPNPQSQSNSNREEALSESSDTRWGLASIMFLATFITTTVAGVSLQGIAPEELNSNPNLFFTGLTYSLPLLLILSIHEFSHYFAAIYYKIRTTLPYFIPFPFPFSANTFYLGTLGAFSQRRSPIPHRKALFDIAVVGPLAGSIVTLPILIWGLAQSTTVPLENTDTASFDALDPRISLLLSLLSKLALGEQFKAGMALDLHPLAAAGCVGLLITAINLMPLGGLDGGHIVHAVFGQRTAIAVGQVARILSLLFALVHPHFWIWAIVLWLIPLIDRPALNDVTELDNWRDLGGLLCLTLFVLMILPLPSPLASLLHM